MLLLQKGTAIKRKIRRGFLVSEKLDGERAFWDGGISRGIMNPPWRHRGKSTVKQMAAGTIKECTGLFTINGNPIYAPDWWLDKLPKDVLLDGELWMGYGKFQELRSIVGRKDSGEWLPDTGPWSRVRYRVFDAPTHDCVFGTRIVKSPTCNMIIKRDVCNIFVAEQGGVWIPGSRTSKESLIEAQLVWGDCIDLKELGEDIDLATAIHDYAAPIWEAGGEGIIVRDGKMAWTPNRVPWVMKVKQNLDGEGELIGFVAGKGKHLGRMGSLLIKYGDVSLAISGFTDDERETSDSQYCKDHAGVSIELSQLFNDPIKLVGLPFTQGSMVGFKYRELSDDGIPKEARYDRSR